MALNCTALAASSAGSSGLTVGASGFSCAQMTVVDAMIKGAVVAATAPLEATISANSFSMDQAWLVLGGALVFFMHSGFGLLEVGSVSARNVQNILFKNVVSPTAAALLFWVCGYSESTALGAVPSFVVVLQLGFPNV